MRAPRSTTFTEAVAEEPGMETVTVPVPEVPPAVSSPLPEIVSNDAGSALYETVPVNPTSGWPTASRTVAMICAEPPFSSVSTCGEIRTPPGTWCTETAPVAWISPEETATVTTPAGPTDVTRPVSLTVAINGSEEE